MKTITYTYRGGVKRGSNYHWEDGYSETTPDGGVLYPWMTRKECIADAKTKGCKAIFYTGPEHASRFDPEVMS